MGKATALCDWKSKLKAWRAWRAVVWAGQKQREVARTEEALRLENRQEPESVNVKLSIVVSFLPSPTNNWLVIESISIGHSLIEKFMSTVQLPTSSWGQKVWSHPLPPPGNASWLLKVTEDGCYGDVWMSGSYGVGRRRNSVSFWPGSRKSNKRWLP